MTLKPHMWYGTGMRTQDLARHAAFARAYVETWDADLAKAEAGYSSSTPAWNILQSDGVQRAMARAMADASTQAAPEALGLLRGLVRQGNALLAAGRTPNRQHVEAAKTILARLAPKDEVDASDLAGMTNDRLLSFVQAGEAVLADRATDVSPPMDGLRAAQDAGIID